jgi:hypothetical protein
LNPCSYAYLIFDKDAKKTASSINVAGETGYLLAENWN